MNRNVLAVLSGAKSSHGTVGRKRGVDVEMFLKTRRYSLSETVDAMVPSTRHLSGMVDALVPLAGVIAVQAQLADILRDGENGCRSYVDNAYQAYIYRHERGTVAYTIMSGILDDMGDACERGDVYRLRDMLTDFSDVATEWCMWEAAPDPTVVVRDNGERIIYATVVDIIIRYCGLSYYTLSQYRDAIEAYCRTTGVPWHHREHEFVDGLESIITAEEEEDN